MIQSAAPSMPDVDQPHKIPIIDVKLAHIVEDYIERVLEMPRTVDVRSASRELGAIANPGKGRRREVANLSEPVLHLLATRLLLRDATLTPDYRMIAATIGAIRAGSFTAAQLQVAAREVRALGAPSANRNWIPGTTTNGPLWCLCGHVLAEWEGGMKLAVRLSQDLDRDDGAHEGVHSEVVRLTQSLQEIGVRRLWAQEFEGVDFQSRSEVYWTLVRVRAARQQSPAGSALRPAKSRSENAVARVDDAMTQLWERVTDANHAARDWVERGISRRRRPRSAS